MNLQVPLMLFTLFVCTGAGLMFFQGLLGIKQPENRMTRPVMVTSLVFVLVGGICAYFHLQHFDRFFNGFAHITSGITLELIFVFIFAVAGIVVYAVCKKDTPMPKWAAILAIVISAVTVFVMSCSYLMASKPAWCNAALPVFYLTNAAALGSIGLLAVAALMKCEEHYETLERYALWGTLIGLVGMVIYTIVLACSGGAATDFGYFLNPTDLTYTAPTAYATAQTLFAGSGAVYTWGGLILGAVMPVISALMAKKDAKHAKVWALVGIICALVGGYLFRGAIYVAGFTIVPIY